MARGLAVITGMTLVMLGLILAVLNVLAGAAPESPAEADRFRRDARCCFGVAVFGFALIGASVLFA